MKKTFDDWLQQQLGLKKGTPTYSAADATEIGKARQEIDQVFDAFLDVTTEWNDKYKAPDDDDDPFAEYAAKNTETTPPPPVHAACVTTGSGKTRRVAKKLAQRSKARRDAGMVRETWLYTVPTHYLSEELAKYFREVGLITRVYYGRRADDRSIPGNMEKDEHERTKMCLALDKVAIAEAAGKSINESCCKYKKQYCEFHPEGSGCKTCNYQEQLRGEQPDVWIASHQMLFHPQKAFGKLAGVIVDENFVVKSGVYGIAKPRRKRKDEDDDTDDIPGMVLDDLASDKCEWRESLIGTLQEHPLGGLQRDRLIGGKEASARELAYCKHAAGLEWKVVNDFKLTPEMSPEQIETAKTNVAACRRARWMAGTWSALREWLSDPSIEVSGRLTIAKNKAGKLVLQRRGIREIVKACQIPCFIMDATLPSKLILQHFFPQVKMVADIDVIMPEHVHVTQVLDAPVSKLKLWGRDNKPAKGENREAVRRYILQCWLEIDGPRLWLEECQREPDPKLRRAIMLVITQKKFRKWLEGKLPKVSKPAKLPDGIALEHYNNISGLDRYKDVAGEMLIGRIIPSPVDVEAYVGALTGAEPAIKILPAKPGKPRPWYEPVERSIRLADGTAGVVVERCDKHPDVMAEAVRLMLCEGEMIQAFGRARAIIRDAPEKALRVWLVNNVVLDLTVNKVSRWTEPSEMVEPLAIDGLVVTSPSDMAAGWPGIWENARAAKWTLKKLKALGRGATTEDILSSVYYTLEKMSSVLFHEWRGDVLYQRPGERQKLREAGVDLRIWPIPREGLVKKLGGAFAAILYRLRKPAIGPLAGAGKLDIDDAKVTVLKGVWETLDQLFDRAAKHPWRKLPDEVERAPSKPRYTLSGGCQRHPRYTGAGRAGRYTMVNCFKCTPTYTGSPGGITTPSNSAHEAAQT
jgi:hypothetical protein